MKKLLRISSLFIAPIFVTTIVALPSQAAVGATVQAPQSDPALPVVANGLTRYVARFTDSFSSSGINSLLTVFDAKQQRKFSRAFNGGVFDMPPGQAKKMATNPAVLWLEEDRAVKNTASVSPTPSWGLDRVDQVDLPFDSTYSYASTGAGVTAYVVDTGVKIGHSEFSGRYRNGYDAFVQGGDDCNGHGTHVAGTLAGATYGVAPATSVVSVRVLDCAGNGSLSGVISGIEWVIADHVSGPAVMNLSLGTSKSPSLESAIDRAFADGITVVTAAGNANTDACNTSPAGNKTSALTVGATTTTDARASFSNYGTCLDLFAPGGSITSANFQSDVTPSVMSGTSMAAPHVSGIAARLLSANISATPTAIMDLIVNSASASKLTSIGSGSPNKLLHLDGAVTPVAPTTTTPATNPFPNKGAPGTGNAVTPTSPGKPSRPKVTAGALSAWADWTEPNDGGLPISGHVVRVYVKKKLTTQVVLNAESLHVVFGLMAGTPHSFTVASMNGVGVGPFSEMSNAVTPVKTVKEYGAPSLSNLLNILPGKPTSVSARRSGSQLIVRWKPPQNAAVSSFEIRIYKRGNLHTKVITPSTGGIKISGLPRGTYAIHVTSTNMAGSSEHSPRRTVVL